MDHADPLTVDVEITKTKLTESLHLFIVLMVDQSNHTTCATQAHYEEGQAKLEAVYHLAVTDQQGQVGKHFCGQYRVRVVDSRCERLECYCNGLLINEG